MLLLCLPRGGILAEQRVVVIGTSAGGVDALILIARALPPDFPAPIAVVLHIPADSPSMLAQILDRNGHLRAKNGEDGERFERGTIYVAPPDRHLLLKKDGTFRVARGPRENRHRPAVDPLFRSAAVACGRNVIAVVLTGALDDGTAGAVAVKRRGGTVIVQDPREALYPSMPESAIEHVKVDHVVALAGLAPLLMKLAGEPPAPRGPVAAPPPEMDREAGIAELEHDALHDDDRPGQPSPYSCPDCGGVLWEIQEDDFVHYRCRVGHALSPETMLSAQDEVLEEAIWSAMKTLEESARLSRRMAVAEHQRGHDLLAKRFEEKEADARHRVEVIRRYLLRGEPNAQQS